MKNNLKYNKKIDCKNGPEGNSKGSLSGSSGGSLRNSSEGNSKGSLSIDSKVNSKGRVSGSSEGNSKGSLSGSSKGNLSIDSKGSSKGRVSGSSEGSLSGNPEGNSKGSSKGGKGRVKKKRPMYNKFCISALAFVVATLFNPMSANAPYLPTIQVENGTVPLAAPLLPDSSAQFFVGSMALDGPDFLGQGYYRASISAGSQTIQTMLLNPDDNGYELTFEIVLDSTDETLFMSGLVAPSMFIGSIDLVSALGEGEHKATLITRFYLPDSLEYSHSSRMDFFIDVS